MNEKIELTAIMKYLVIAIVFFDYLSNTGLITSSIYSALMAVSILMTYFVFSKRRGGFALIELIVLLISFLFVILNRDPSNFSLGLMWILYFIFRKCEINGRVLLKTYAITASICFSISVILYYLIGFNKKSDMLMWRNEGFVPRLSLGFIQPNMTMMSFLGIILALLYLSNMKRKNTVLMIIATLIVFKLTQSRTSGYIIFILLGICLIFGKKYMSVVSKALKRLVLLLPIVLSAISFAMLKLPINERLDSLLSGRISLYQMIYYEFGIHLLGNSASKSTMLDTGYLQAMIAKGILFTLFLAISFYIILFKSRKNQTRVDMLVIAVYFLVAFTETSFFRFVLLLPVLIIAMNRIAFESPTNHLSSKKEID
ncbi:MULTISPECIES: hypothetical protein [unclassified Lactococcus]|uniref:hypothetical protein n=1 Tax=unclassified Lactococcus TaxID=2643510 RepID=UPI0011C86A07|nr:MULTISPECIES: hypothetical protein [unclassified Lactococcus]MQW22632.1 hypothetical protein [Lactococcus sp. dk101]TXK45651.1 hypothetical protein FVP42_01575 [Lactococcus sp. dk310]TXK51503.1 hypothetical protein FVP43_01580 [Lactococcus sp. dk322]